jgi:hypothetical protein
MAKNNSKNQIASEISRRGEWLSGLTDRQIKALASQRKVMGWVHLSPIKLIGELIRIEDIDVPVRA